MANLTLKELIDFVESFKGVDTSIETNIKSISMVTEGGIGNKIVVNLSDNTNVIGEPAYLDVYFGERFDDYDIEDRFDSSKWCTIEDFAEDFPEMIKDGQFYLRINLSNGKVENWTYGDYGNFRTVKIVDEGIYTLLDSNLNVIHTYEGYVPDILEIESDGWGDYFEFNVTKDGYIENWWEDPSDYINQILNDCHSDEDE